MTVAEKIKAAAAAAAADTGKVVAEPTVPDVQALQAKSQSGK